MREYIAPGQTTGFAAAAAAFLGARPGGGAQRWEDYDLWIRTAIRWLFAKRTSVASWEEAIQAYNGSGRRAADYRAIVVQRARDAKTAAAAGRPFVPSGI
jgi:hypothetical protein